MNGGTRSVIGAGPLFPPLDRRLSIPWRGGSARLQRKVCEANEAGSFEKASRLLGNLAGLSISAKRVELMTERVGRALGEEIVERTGRYCNRQAPPPTGMGAALMVVNRAAMNYPAFRQNGWPIGSGIIESTIKQLGKRLKGSEKHCNLTGAEETLQVMASLISTDAAWADFWNRCPLSRAA